METTTATTTTRATFEVAVRDLGRRPVVPDYHSCHGPVAWLRNQGHTPTGVAIEINGANCAARECSLSYFLEDSDRLFAFWHRGRPVPRAVWFARLLRACEATAE